jgi:hypothetical protein
MGLPEIEDVGHACQDISTAVPCESDSIGFTLAILAILAEAMSHVKR